MSRHFASALKLAFIVGGSVLALASGAARSAERPIIQAGAGGRYERQIDTKVAIPGARPAEIAAFRVGVDKVVAQLDSMSSVREPPAPICHRLGSYLEVTRPNGMLSAEVFVMTPIAFEGGRCARMTGGGVDLWLNRPQLLDPSHALVRDADGGRDWYVLPSLHIEPGRIELAENGTTAVALTRPGADLLRPVTVERYARVRADQASKTEEAKGSLDLERWRKEERPRLERHNAQTLAQMAKFMTPGQLAEFRKTQEAVLLETEKTLMEMASAAPDATSVARERGGTEGAIQLAARNKPACLAEDFMTLDLSNGCPETRRVWELNPYYFDKTRPDALQLIVASTPTQRYHGENDAMLASRGAMWSELDLTMLASLLLKTETRR